MSGRIIDDRYADLIEPDDTRYGPPRQFDGATIHTAARLALNLQRAALDTLVPGRLRVTTERRPGRLRVTQTLVYHQLTYTPHDGEQWTCLTRFDADVADAEPAVLAAAADLALQAFRTTHPHIHPALIDRMAELAGL